MGAMNRGFGSAGGLSVQVRPPSLLRAEDRPTYSVITFREFCGSTTVYPPSPPKAWTVVAGTGVPVSPVTVVGLGKVSADPLSCSPPYRLPSSLPAAE